MSRHEESSSCGVFILEDDVDLHFMCLVHVKCSRVAVVDGYVCRRRLLGHGSLKVALCRVGIGVKVADSARMADGHELVSMSNAGPQQDGRALTPTLWACGAASQAVAARILAKRGDGGPSMPFRAFSIASLVLGAGFCALGGTLWASGIREVEDLRSMGRTIRSAFGKPPRTHA